MAKAKKTDKINSLVKATPLLLITISVATLLFVFNFHYFGLVGKVEADQENKNLVRFWDFKSLKLNTYPVNVKKQNPPKVSAKSAIVFDPDSKMILFSKEPNQKLPPASIVKLATALVALQNCSPNQVIKISTVNVSGTKAGLKPGDLMSVEGLLYALLLPSGNDAAQVLSNNCRNNNEHFSSSMNSLARLLGMYNTQFTNPTGLDSPLQYSTAYDLAQLANAVADNNQLASIVSTKEITFGNANNTSDYHFVNLNRLLAKTQGVLGIKTGTTEAAGENLVTLVNRNNQRIITVVLGSTNRFSDSEQLIDWTYSNYDWIDFGYSN